jgi:hypothetical protein
MADAGSIAPAGFDPASSVAPPMAPVAETILRPPPAAVIKPPTTAQFRGQYVPRAVLDRIAKGDPVTSIIKSTVSALQDGITGQGDLGFSPENIKALQDAGVYPSGPPSFANGLRMWNQALLNPIASVGDAFTRAFSGGVQAAGAGVKQTAIEAGATEGTAESLGAEATNFGNYLLMRGDIGDNLGRIQADGTNGHLDQLIGPVPKPEEVGPQAAAIATHYGIPEAAPAIEAAYHETGVLPAEVHADIAEHPEVAAKLAAGDNPYKQEVKVSFPEPEKIVSATIQLKDGRTFAGQTHADAAEAALNTGVPEETINQAILDQRDGFMTDQGRIVDRTEAMDVAKKAGQRMGALGVTEGTELQAEGTLAPSTRAPMTEADVEHFAQYHQAPREVTPTEPVAPEAAPKTRPLPLKTIEGTGEEKVRAVPEAVQERTEADLGPLPTYRVSTDEVNLANADDLHRRDPELFRAISLMQRAAPKGIMPEAVFVRAVDRAEAAGDVEMQRRLANSPLGQAATTMGQRISMYRNLNKEGATAGIKMVNDAKAALLEKQGVDVKAEVDKIVADATAVTRKARSSLTKWNDFVKSIQCE